MLAIDGSFLDFKQLDLLALRQTPVHRLDPRAKVLTTLCFIVCVVSFDRYQISAMLPFMIYPAVLMAVGDLPFGYILRKILIARCLCKSAHSISGAAGFPVSRS
jgi:cobalt/nickel transport system permease protein